MDSKNGIRSFGWRDIHPTFLCPLLVQIKMISISLLGCIIRLVSHNCEATGVFGCVCVCETRSGCCYRYLLVQSIVTHRQEDIVEIERATHYLSPTLFLVGFSYRFSHFTKQRKDENK